MAVYEDNTDITSPACTTLSGSSPMEDAKIIISNETNDSNLAYVNVSYSGGEILNPTSCSSSDSPYTLIVMIVCDTN